MKNNLCYSTTPKSYCHQASLLRWNQKNQKDGLFSRCKHFGLCFLNKCRSLKKFYDRFRYGPKRISHPINPDSVRKFCTSERNHLKRFTHRVIKTIRILSFSEIENLQNVKIIGLEVVRRRQKLNHTGCLRMFVRV